MRAYRGVVREGKVELQGGDLPEGTQVTVTVGEPEYLLATLLEWMRGRRRIRISLGPAAGMARLRVTWLDPRQEGRGEDHGGI